MKKRIISFLLAIGLVVSFLPTAASAEAPTANEAAIAAAVYAKTGIAASDDDWAKYVKNQFAARTGISNSSSADAISWYDTQSERDNNLCSAPWDGTLYAPPATQPLPTVIGNTEIYKDGNGKTIMTVKRIDKTHSAEAEAYEFHVWTAETLAYALKIFSRANSDPKTGGFLYLEQSIDMNGENYNWSLAPSMNYAVTFDGQGHTIYNLCSIKNTNHGGLVVSIDRGTKIKNMTFQTAYIVGKAGVGVIGFAGANGRCSVSDLHVKDAVVVGDEQIGSVFGRGQDSLSVERCSAENCAVFGRHAGSLTGGLINNTSVKYSYSRGCSVYAPGGHSGGLVACGGNITVENCFTDVEVYGSIDTGAFIGATNGTCHITNCFASGFVEGNERIGGFIGTVEKDASYVTNDFFTDCYSTAVVGIRSGAKSEGGFVGQIGSNTTSSFKNCYAAGEVGSTDIEMAENTLQPQANGGFVGLIASNSVSFADCYYDKQTTAMRECGVGKVNATGVGLAGITGVLTTATKKSGNGLMTSSPTGTEGFSRFDSDAWSYSAAGHYPELAAFSSADAAAWGNSAVASLVKAYSLASTSGIILATWDYGYNAATGLLDTETLLPSTTYCTVRDLTSGFRLTSAAVEGWIRSGTQDSSAEKPSKATVNGTQYDVLSLKYQNGQYLCDELVPGVEWLMVTAKVNGQEATRRVRVIPTAAIEAGKSVVVSQNAAYNHRADVEMFFSTASRMSASGNTDISYGNYPGDPDSDEFYGLEVSGMSAPGVSDNATGSKLYVYAHEITGINATTGLIETSSDLIQWDAPDADRDAPQGEATYGEQFNGEANFTNRDTRYLVVYLWQLADGRALQDAKIVRSLELPFVVSVNVFKDMSDATLAAYIADMKKAESERRDYSAYLYTSGAETYVGATDTAYSTAPGAQNSADFDLYVPSATAWKLTDRLDTLKSVTLTMDILKNEDGQTIESYSKSFTTGSDGLPLHNNSELDMTYTFYRIVYKDGEYHTIPEEVKRTYTLHRDAAGVYYIEFDYDGSVANSLGLSFHDMEFNLRADVVVETYTPPHPRRARRDRHEIRRSHH